ncbi:MAG: RNA polymerase sigma factor [Pseudomonadota bacterium]
MTDEPHRAAFLREMRALYPRVWRYCYALSAAADDASDLAQSTMVRGLEHAATFRPGMPLDRWLFTLARRLWLNDRRSARQRAGVSAVGPAGLDVADGGPDVVSTIVAGEVFASVMALPPAQRETVLLVYVEGYTYREAAELLAIPIGTVMSRLAAARARIARVHR